VLFDGEGGGESLDGIDGGGRQPFKMETCVGGEAFEITPLAFRVDCVER
jgi:hypothetical protein